MKRILYITNIEVPYKVKFFNLLAQKADLTVLYERANSANRDSGWAKSEEIKYNREYLKGIELGNENSFSLSMLKYLNRDYDVIIISCINSPVQLMAILYMKLRRKKYVLSFDGEFFVSEKGIKSFVKRIIITGADKYLMAGEISARNICKFVNSDKVYPYYFSSYTDEEIIHNGNEIAKRDDHVLVVGQYFDYKGLDIAVNVARLDKNIKYLFVGMGKRTELFCKNEKINECENIDVIPFLSPHDLNEEYKKAAVLLLPSRRECWGLVINEAASFGTPIVSTNGSGAAIEFLSGKDKCYLLEPDDVNGIYKAICSILNNEQCEYSLRLREKSAKYSIENMVNAHVNALSL